MKEPKALFAIFRSKHELVKALNLFRKQGFKDESLFIFQTNTTGDKDFPQVQKNQLCNGIFIGAIVGATMAAIFQLIIASGALPSLIPMGSSLLNIIGTVLLGIIAGAACGLLAGAGTPQPVAKRYGEYLQSGGILLSVKCENLEQENKAENILNKAGGQDIHRADEKQTWDTAILENIKLADIEPDHNLQIVH